MGFRQAWTSVESLSMLEEKVERLVHNGLCAGHAETPSKVEDRWHHSLSSYCPQCASDSLSSFPTVTYRQKEMRQKLLVPSLVRAWT